MCLNPRPTVSVLCVSTQNICLQSNHWTVRGTVPRVALISQAEFGGKERVLSNNHRIHLELKPVKKIHCSKYDEYSILMVPQVQQTLLSDLYSDF